MLVLLCWYVLDKGTDLRPHMEESRVSVATGVLPWLKGRWPFICTCYCVSHWAPTLINMLLYLVLSGGPLNTLLRTNQPELVQTRSPKPSGNSIEVFISLSLQMSSYSSWDGPLLAGAASSDKLVATNPQQWFVWGRKIAWICVENHPNLLHKHMWP